MAEIAKTMLKDSRNGDGTFRGYELPSSRSFCVEVPPSVGVADDVAAMDVFSDVGNDEFSSSFDAANFERTILCGILYPTKPNDPTKGVRRMQNVNHARTMRIWEVRVRDTS